MRKSMFLVVVALGFGLSQANAQNVSFGVKTEANASSFSVSGMGDVKSKMGLGASAGGFAVIDFGKYFALQPEVLLNMQNSNLKMQGVKNNLRTWNVEVPVYAVGQMKLSNDSRMYVGVGPYASYGINARNRTADVNLYGKNGLMKRFDAGAAAMIGYEFSCGIQVNASYKYGLLNLSDGSGKLKNRVIGLGIGYRF